VLALLVFSKYVYMASLSSYYTFYLIDTFHVPVGAAPFTLALPHADLFWTGVLSVVIGLVMSSAFSAIVVFAQELVPGKAGMGHIADVAGIGTVYWLASFLSVLGGWRRSCRRSRRANRPLRSIYRCT
jgi:FSR family fosmidomycin resistance protein-like MFS transporter